MPAVEVIRAIGDELVRTERTLAVAESVTGGGLAASLTSVSGASAFFLGGVVAYDLEVKISLLGVGEDIARSSNGVSAGVAQEMASGARRLFGSSIGLATTGYAEPAHADDCDVPRAVWALSFGRPAGSELMSWGWVEGRGLDRTSMQQRVVDVALDKLRARLAAESRHQACSRGAHQPFDRRSLFV